MQFSPLQLEYSILEPLRYFFTHYAGDDLKYSEDIRQTKIIIRAINDVNIEDNNHIPRITIDRGGYTISRQWLAESMAVKDPLHVTKGLAKEQRHAMVEGQASIYIESRQQGTCERITESISLFLSWTGDQICRTYGYKKFGDRIMVSPCSTSKVDTDTFVTQIALPYQAEMLWQYSDAAVKIKEVNLGMS